MLGTAKKVCVHFHIFKNAGSTIDWTLKKNFGSDHITMDDQAKSPDEIFEWDRVMRFLKQYPEVKAFSSHIIRFPLPENDLYDFLPMVFIRHPIDRAFSIYSFKKRDTDNAIATIVAKTGSFKEFVEWNLSIKKYTVMKNFQVQYLSRDNYDFIPINDNDYKLSLTRIQNCFIIGVVDRIDESLVVAEESLKPFFNKIDLSYMKQNVSQDRKGNLNERLAHTKEILGSSLYAELENHNKFDFRLYESANDELNSRIAQIPNFDTKLDNFKERCKKLIAVNRRVFM
jgi:hypothetical protein